MASFAAEYKSFYFSILYHACLWAQTLQLPVTVSFAISALIFSLVHKAVVQPAIAALPELYALRNNAQPAPKVWHRYLVSVLEALLCLLDPALQLLSSVIGGIVFARL